MDRVFTELSPRRDEMAQLYAIGLEKKEIANRLFRSFETVRATLQCVFTGLHVQNRSELTIRYAERLTGYDFKKGMIATSLLLLFVFDLYVSESDLFRRSRRAEEERAEAHCEEREENLFNPFES